MKRKLIMETAVDHNDQKTTGLNKNKRISITLGREITLPDILGKFITLKQAMNMSPETIKCYSTFFKRFINYYGENKPVANIVSDDIINFIIQIQKDNPSIEKTSINTYLRHIRAILYFAMEAGMVSHFKIKLIRAEKKIKETYTDDELEKL